LTIDGVRIVIDAGLLRVPRFNPRSGLTRLETIRVTQDSAEQRRGRAGRLEPGVCSRLWTAAEHQSLTPRRPPEMLDADLAPLLLELALWGTANPAELSWLTPPPVGAIAQARELLTSLEAINAEGQITAHGRQMAELPLHPRLAHMLLKAGPLRLTSLASELAALLSERDILRGPSGWRNADLRLRLDILHDAHNLTTGATLDRTAYQRVKRTAGLWQRQLTQQADKRQADKQEDLYSVGLLLALAYPDRLAQRQQGNEARYLMANGRGALFLNPDPLESEDYLVIADLDGGAQWARIDLAAPVQLGNLETLYEDRVQVIDEVSWDDRAQVVHATRQRRLGSLILSKQGLAKPDPAQITAALSQGLRRAGLDKLAWTPELRQWQARVAFLRRIEGPESQWPDLSNEALLHTLDEWLGPYLSGLTTLDRVRRLDLSQPLHALLSWDQQRQLERLAPPSLTVPSGSTIRMDSETPDLPILAVRLQEMFGCKDTPRLVGGKISVMLHLLSPARRPVQVTKDLSSFWKSAYPEVRKELRGRYPKHSWPDDPLKALPTAKIKRRLH
jgi:ATP-dependent helicase HrpB